MKLVRSEYKVYPPEDPRAGIEVSVICDRTVLLSFCSFSTPIFSTGLASGIDNEDITFVIPGWLKDIPTGMFPKPTGKEVIGASPQGQDWFNDMVRAEKAYFNKLNKLKWSIPQAVVVLPNAVREGFRVSLPIEKWHGALKLRVGVATPPQLLEITRPVLNEFKKIYGGHFLEIVY